MKVGIFAIDDDSIRPPNGGEKGPVHRQFGETSMSAVVPKPRVCPVLTKVAVQRENLLRFVDRSHRPNVHVHLNLEQMFDPAFKRKYFSASMEHKSNLPEGAGP